MVDNHPIVINLGALNAYQYQRLRLYFDKIGSESVIKLTLQAYVNDDWFLPKSENIHSKCVNLSPNKVSISIEGKPKDVDKYLLEIANDRTVTRVQILTYLDWFKKSLKEKIISFENDVSKS